MNDNEQILQRVAIKNAMKNQKGAGDLVTTVIESTWQFINNHTVVKLDPQKGIVKIVTSSNLHLPDSVAIWEDVDIFGAGTVYVGEKLIYNGSPKSNTPSVTTGDITGNHGSTITVTSGDVWK